VKGQKLVDALIALAVWAVVCAVIVGMAVRLALGE